MSPSHRGATRSNAVSRPGDGEECHATFAKQLSRLLAIKPSDRDMSIFHHAHRRSRTTRALARCPGGAGRGWGSGLADFLRGETGRLLTAGGSSPWRPNTTRGRRAPLNPPSAKHHHHHRPRSVESLLTLQAPCKRTPYPSPAPLMSTRFARSSAPVKKCPSARRKRNIEGRRPERVESDNKRDEANPVPSR